jgi:glycerophosphoryl diester phosphodiesterase
LEIKGQSNGKEPEPENMPGLNQRRIEVHGHRGARAVLPENSLPAFEYAIAAGADAIEFDLQVTKDNVIVISHDPVLHPPICTGPKTSAVIRELTLEEVKQWDCGAVKNPEFPEQQSVPGTRIPTLDEVFALAPKGNFRFLLEAKSTPKRLTDEEARVVLRKGLSMNLPKEQEDRYVRILMVPGPEMTPPPDEYVRMVLDKIRSHHIEDRTVFMSINYRLLRIMKEIAPDINLAAPYGGGKDMMEVISVTGAHIVGPSFTKVTVEQVKAAHNAGVQVVPFSNNIDEWQLFVDIGVDGIVTDDPAGLFDYLTRRGYR